MNVHIPDMAIAKAQGLKFTKPEQDLLAVALKHSPELKGFVDDMLNIAPEQRWAQTINAVRTLSILEWKNINPNCPDIMDQLAMRYEQMAVAEFAHELAAHGSLNENEESVYRKAATSLLRLCTVGRFNQLIDVHLADAPMLRQGIDRKLLQSLLFKVIFAGTPEYESNEPVHAELQAQKTPAAIMAHDMFALCDLNKLLISEAVSSDMHMRGIYRKSQPKIAKQIVSSTGERMAEDLNEAAPELRIDYRRALGAAVAASQGLIRS